MSLRPPRLDDRRYEDLREELVRRIPAHTPEWTNPRQGDPGVTLIELFAWLADTILYRANLIPERQRLVFLSLLGQNPLPARAARVGNAFAESLRRRLRRRRLLERIGRDVEVGVQRCRHHRPPRRSGQIGRAHV